MLYLDPFYVFLNLPVGYRERDNPGVQKHLHHFSKGEIWTHDPEVFLGRYLPGRYIFLNPNSGRNASRQDPNPPGLLAVLEKAATNAAVSIHNP